MANAQPQHYNIRWNNYHSNLVAVFDEFLINASFADVTLFLDDGRCLKCHKVVLAACSNYFQDIFFKEPHKHIVVALKDVKYGEIKSILEFMYRGEIHVAHDQLSNLLRVAKSFQVKGLHDINDFQNLLIPRDYATNAETSVSPPYSSPPLSQQPISNITSSIPHNNRPSPPHSTELDATSQGLMKRLDRYIHSGGIFESRTSKFLPGNIHTEDERFPLYQCQYPLPFMALPTTHSMLQSTTNPNSGSSSSQTMTMNTSNDIGHEEPHYKRRKRLLPKHSPPVPDTPILRTVLNQRQIDSSQTPLPSISSDNNDAARTDVARTDVARTDVARTDVARTDAVVTLNERNMQNMNIHYESLESSSYNNMIEEENKQSHPPTSTNKNTNTNTNTNTSTSTSTSLQKPEWKRYKQYTREDISNAIESVKSGTSALQAARIWGVPSRTLYDKVKKLGITNNRSSKRSAGRSSSSAEYSCNYGENSNYPTNSSYVSECDDETDNSHNHHENNTSMIQQPETSSYSSHITVKNESNKLNRDSNDQNNLHEDSLMIKEENDEQYSNYDDEIQDLSMHSKNNKTIATSNINNKDSDNMNHS